MNEGVSLGLDQLLMILIVFAFIGFGWYLARRQQQNDLYGLIKHVLSLNDSEREKTLSLLKDLIIIQKETQATLSELLRTQQAALHGLDPETIRLIAQLDQYELRTLVEHVQQEER